MKTDSSDGAWTRRMRRTSRGFALALLCLGLAPAARGADFWLLTPAADTNATHNAPYMARAGFTPVGVQLAAAVTSGTNIVPQASLLTAYTTPTNWTVTLTPQAHASGTVTVKVTGWLGAWTNTTSFNVFFKPCEPVVLTPAFASPATNSAPGAAFSGQVEFAPTGVVFAVDFTSGGSVIQSYDVSLVDDTHALITLTPKSNKSGPVSVRLTGTTACATNAVDFDVFFKRYPPTISSIADQTVAEDGSKSVSFTVGDADTSLDDLVIWATSDNETLINASGMSTGGSGADRTLTLTPNPNENGTATITVWVSDGYYNVSETLVLTVTAVADPSTIAAPASVYFTDNAGATNAFSAVTIDDVDHNRPSPESLQLTVTLGDDGAYAILANGTSSFTATGTPGEITATIRALAVEPRPFQGVPGSVNLVTAQIVVQGAADHLSVTQTVELRIEVVNTPPGFSVSLDPATLGEGQSAQPFHLDYISEFDTGDEEFTLAVSLADPAQAYLGYLGSTNALTDNETGLQAGIRGLVFYSNAGVLTAATARVDFRFNLTDFHGGTAVATQTLTIVQAQTPPSISGIPAATVDKTDASPAFAPLPDVFVQDVDMGGVQGVSATVTLSLPSLGTLSKAVFPLQTPLQLTAALRAMTFTPASGAIPVGSKATTLLTVTVTDATGLTSQNNNLSIRITSVNHAPQILNVPAEQPLLIPPQPPLRPFAGLGLASDDTNAVQFKISLDNTAKGTLGNLGGFSAIEDGCQMDGSAAAIVAALTNITFTLAPGYLFPVDDPGGTVFTLSARDYALLTSTRTLAIQVQLAPRNHLVVRSANDGLPGSFNHALAAAGNNDVITFALPEYPAMIRMPGAATTPLVRNLTIKGPGANLLTISGDGNGDGLPDRQIFRVAARVTIEGVTLASGTAALGGAVSVDEGGELLLRYCAVVDNVADEYGGAIDVDGGALTLESCWLAGNRLSTADGRSGGAVSVYSDRDILIANTTFYQNRQGNASGYGGGALVVEKRTAGWPMHADLHHCTFAGNQDASGMASAVFANGAGVLVRPANCVFADASERNLNVYGGGLFESQGGNICDDSTKVALSQGGGDVYLLDHVTDLAPADPRLAPPAAGGDPTPFLAPLTGSPAVDRAFLSETACDQRGVRREGVPDAGAIESGAFGRLVVNEIGVDPAAVGFIEIFVRRDSTPVDLAGCALYLDGIKVHEFSAGTIIGTNALFAAGTPAATMLDPGFGMVLAFTNAPFKMTSDSNPTPVVRPSVAGAPRPGVRGTLAIMQAGSAEPVVRQHWLGLYRDPATGTNDLDLAGNSISLAPQFRGFALVPHSFVLPGAFGGADTSIGLATRPSSPGADAAGTPFGQDNSEPYALPDIFTVTEDTLATLNVLANDYDSDGNDRLVIVDVSTLSAPGAGDAARTNSVRGALLAVQPAATPLRGSALAYDPRLAPLLQQLPVGVEMIDSFCYETIDIGSGAVEGYGVSGTQTVVTATCHRLATGDEVVIAGASVTNYNGTFTIAVVDADTFTIPVAFAGVPAAPGAWETVLPRLPTSRAEAAATVRVMGANDAPMAVPDTITNVTEETTLRIMVRPEFAGRTIVFPGDPIPAPAVSAQNLLANDGDIDSDDTWSTLGIVGILGAVNPVGGFSGTAGDSPVIVASPAHGLATGDEVLVANYGGHPSYNGYHAVTVLDADTFSIPVRYVDDNPQKGVWAILDDANRLQATTPAGVPVALTLRADPRENHLVYNAGDSAFLDGLAEGERHDDTFWYAVADSHGAIGIGSITVEITGVNDDPLPVNDPGDLEILDPLVSPSNILDQILAEGLDLMYTLPGAPGRADLHVIDLGGTLPGTLVLRGIFATDEDTPLAIPSAELLANDADIDRLDVLSVDGVAALSREGAAVALDGAGVTYDPTASTSLQTLARGEMRIDTFTATITDSMGGNIDSLVAVLVIGVNDTPTAIDDTRITNEDEIFAFDPRVNDIEIDIDGNAPDDRLSIVPADDLPNPGQADVDLAPTNVMHNATVSDLLNQLADWQVFTNVFDYTVTDNSLLVPVDDEFHVPAGAAGRLLDVLANDRDFTDGAGSLAIVDAGPALYGGAIGIVSNGGYLVYSSPAGFAGDDTFRYLVRNAAGDTRAARVTVRSVIPALNGILHASDDRFLIAAGETVALPLTANDGMLPGGGAGLVVTGLSNVSVTGALSVVDGTVFYTATNGLAPLTFSYTVSAGGSSTARADVVATILDRRGTLGVRDDAFSVLAASQGNALDVLVNDGLVTESTAGLRIAAIAETAAHGAVTLNAGATGLLYTPNPGFAGVERFSYVATDRIGGTGTGRVSVVVGRVEAVGDFFKLEAANTNAVLLDVLANDRTQPAAPDTLRLVSVTPSGATAIGTLGINGPGTRLRFTAGGAYGQESFAYVISDASMPARLATGVVSIATVAPGTYANPDRFRVRGGGSGYVLDVLANDRGFPANNRVYSILALGSGADAPDAGGLVAIVDNRLVYTPAAGFTGEEHFTYTLSDSVATDLAQVTVTVAPGDLFANDDDYAVFYAWDADAGAPRDFELPVTLNDRLLPALDQVFQIATLGVGAQAPNAGGSVTIAPGGLSLIYRPGAAPTTEFTERFAYEIADGAGQRAAGQVRVRVRNRADHLVALTRDDAFTVGRSSVGNLLPVLANDGVRPGSAAGWAITGVSATLAGGTVAISGSQVRYAPPSGHVGIDRFTYEVSDGLGGTGSAAVTVRVGDLPVLDDRFAALAGSASNRFDVLANDALDAGMDGEYVLDRVFGATAGGTVELNADNTVRYAPAQAYAGAYPYTEQFAYTVLDDSAVASTGMAEVVVYDPGTGLATGTVTLVVEGRNDLPVILNTTTNAPITDKQSAAVFGGVTLIEVDEQLEERLNVTVVIEEPVGGVFTNLQGFVHVGGGVYVLSNATAAAATDAIRQLVFVPEENLVPVNMTWTARFTVTATDRRSPPVVDQQTTLDVTGVNDAPGIAGTLSDQRFYCLLPYQAFWSVTIIEPDDQALQPIDVTVTVIETDHGALHNLGAFVDLGGGVYQATNLTAAEATAQLRAMKFAASGTVEMGQAVVTHLSLEVDDGYAAPVLDTRTSLIAMNAYSDRAVLRPMSEEARDAFGTSVDARARLAIAGAPKIAIRGAGAGAAYLYRPYYEYGTNNWSAWRQLLPPSIGQGDGFGWSVSLGENFAAVGAPNQAGEGTRRGSVYMFRRDYGGPDAWGEWMRLTPTNAPGANQFGLSVALSGDWLAVGAPDTTALTNGTGGTGTVFVFGRHTGGSNAWGEAMRWSPSGAGSGDAAFGWQVAFDGDTLVVGAPRFDVETSNATREGAVFHFERHQGGSNMWGLVQQVTCPDAAEARQFGHAVAVRGDRLAVGAPFMAAGSPSVSDAGRVYLFRRAAASVVFAGQGQLNAGLATERQFGYSVALDGGCLLVGAPAQASGSAFLFNDQTESGGGWVLIERFTRPADSAAMTFGRAVGFQQGTAIVGAPAYQAGDKGFAFIYRIDYLTFDGLVPAALAPRAAWDAENFGDEIGNPWTELSLWGGSADPDGDGTPNDGEYAFVGDPNTPDQSALLSISRDAGGDWLIGYFRRSNDPALVFTLFASENLADWYDCTESILGELVLPAGTDREQVILRLPDTSIPPVRFFKLVVFW